jgi:hypothetical protein
MGGQIRELQPLILWCVRTAIELNSIRRNSCLATYRRADEISRMAQSANY